MTKIEALRKYVSKYLLILTLALFVGIIIIIEDFVVLWLGIEFQIVARIIIIFAIGMCISMLSTPAWSLLNGLGHAKETLYVEIQTVALNIVGVILFGKFFGFYGFCIGFSISMIYEFLIVHIYYKKTLNLKINVFTDFLNIKVIILNLIFLGISFTFVSFFKLNSYTSLGLFIFVYIIIYSFILFKARVITTKDLKLLLGENIYNKFKQINNITSFYK